METIAIYVNDFVKLCGITGNAVPVTRQAIFLVVAVLLAWLSGLLCSRLIMPLILRITAHTNTKLDDVLLNRRVLTAACRIVPAVVIWGALPLALYKYPAARELAARLTAIYITVMSIKLSTVFIDSLKALLKDASSSSQQYFHSFCGVMKIVAAFVGAVVIVSIVINKSPATLIAGLGATSAVLMLVFQDTIKGLVAGVRLTSNNMLHKGDWITVQKAGADGTVEEMTLTTVKVRNFDNTIVTVTPQALVDDSFKNWIGMQTSPGRRVARKVSYDLRTIEPIGEKRVKSLIDNGYFKSEEIDPKDVNLTLFRRYIERYLSSTKTVNDTMTILVHQLEATPTGLPVEFYFFLRAKEWEPYERDLDDIMDHILAVGNSFGLKVYQYTSCPEPAGKA